MPFSLWSAQIIWAESLEELKERREKAIEEAKQRLSWKKVLHETDLRHFISKRVEVIINGQKRERCWFLSSDEDSISFGYDRDGEWTWSSFSVPLTSVATSPQTQTLPSLPERLWQ